MTDPFPNLFLLLFTFLYNFFSLFVGQPQLFPLGSGNVASENERWEQIKMRCIKIRIRIRKYLNQTNVSFSKEQKGNFGNKMWKPLFNLFHFSFSTFSSINFSLFSAVYFNFYIQKGKNLIESTSASLGILPSWNL